MHEFLFATWSNALERMENDNPDAQNLVKNDQGIVEIWPGKPGGVMRHARFHIDVAARDAWLGAMNKAVQGMDMDEELRVQLWSYLEMAADAMVNQPD